MAEAQTYRISDTEETLPEEQGVAGQGGGLGSQSSPAPRGRSDLGDLAIGEILRRERVRYGKTLEDVEAMLRIRVAYLEAIEQGAYAKLPGRVYALGFVRSYSEYLGLDGNRMIALFKRQVAAAGSVPMPEMNFPASAPEGRSVTPWIVVASLILAVGATTAWVAFNRTAPRPFNEIPSLPDQAAQADSTETMSRKAESLAALEPGPGMAKIEENLRRQIAAVDPSITVEPVELAPAITTDAPSGHEITEASVPAASIAELATPAESGMRHRIILKAVESTWIEIKDDSGKALLSSVLKAGDIYFVPDRPGLVLSTGNAGGFEIEIDGKSAGRLGETGDVRRDIALDPSAIAANSVKAKQE